MDNTNSVSCECAVYSAKQVMDILGISRTKLYRLQRSESVNFPKPLNFGTQSLHWLASDIKEWLNRKGA